MGCGVEERGLSKIMGKIGELGTPHETAFHEAGLKGPPCARRMGEDKRAERVRTADHEARGGEEGLRRPM
jgi:hypothetical protein